MGLLVNNVNVKTVDGGSLTSFWIKTDVLLEEKPNPKISIKLRAYRSEEELDAGSDPVELRDTNQGLASDVPKYLGSIQDDLTPAQYANLDMTQIHNQLRDLLIQGDSHARWADLTPGNQIWAGFGTGNVSREMPT